MSLCFQDAFSALRSGKIEEAEYIHHLLAHFRGIRHSSDAKEQDIDIVLTKHNPYAESIRYAALNTTYKTFEEKAPLESLFSSCLENDIGQVKANLEHIEENHDHTVLLPPLGTLAAEKGHSSILQMCLEKEVSFDRSLDRAVEIGFYKNPDMLNVLSAVKWRNIQTAQDQQAIDEIVRPWLKVNVQPEEHAKEETYGERHERLMRTGMHGPGTCNTAEELEKSFGHINW